MVTAETLLDFCVCASAETFRSTRLGCNATEGVKLGASRPCALLPLWLQRPYVGSVCTVDGARLGGCAFWRICRAPMIVGLPLSCLVIVADLFTEIRMAWPYPSMTFLFEEVDVVATVYDIRGTLDFLCSKLVSSAT